MSADPKARLLAITRELGQSTEIQSYLQSILSAAAELTGSTAASIMEYDQTAKELSFIAGPWVNHDSQQSLKVPLEDSAAGWVIQTGQPLLIPEVGIDARKFNSVIQPEPALRFLKGHSAGQLIKTSPDGENHAHSLLAVPLLHYGRPVGVLEVINKSDGAHYTEEDVTLLETLAALATPAIRNDLLERKIQSSYTELAELDRLKNDFIAIASHELRTPLGLILGHAAFLHESLGREYQEQIDSILKNATKLNEIIETLSSMDKYRSGAARLHQGAVSVGNIIQEVAASFQEMARQKDILLDTQSNEDLFVEADAGKIAVALSNLVRNAILFTDGGGHITLSAESLPDVVIVSVSDDGIGIPPKDLPFIFDRFFQVESHLTRRHGGMGLGLSVAKAMVEMHGGRIWVESVEGRGSKFTFLLPCQGARNIQGPEP